MFRNQRTPPTLSCAAPPLPLIVHGQAPIAPASPVQCAPVMTYSQSPPPMPGHVKSPLPDITLEPGCFVNILLDTMRTDQRPRNTNLHCGLSRLTPCISKLIAAPYQSPIAHTGIRRTNTNRRPINGVGLGTRLVRWNVVQNCCIVATCADKVWSKLIQFHLSNMCKWRVEHCKISIVLCNMCRWGQTASLNSAGVPGLCPCVCPVTDGCSAEVWQALASFMAFTLARHSTILYSAVSRALALELIHIAQNGTKQLPHPGL